MQKPNTKITKQNAKIEFKNRVYSYTLKSLKFINGVHDNKVNRIITNQLIRSLTSIGANVIEARASNSKKDFARYFDIALKSANETKYWLALLKDFNKPSINAPETEKIIQETIEISNILAASLLTMRNKRIV